MTDPIENSELLAFTKTVDARSLSRAAQELRVPRATIGRRLQRLEEKLEVRLLRRTTRSLVLTDAGEAFYRQARIALDAVRQAEAVVRRTDDGVRGDLRVSVPPFTSESFFRMLNDFVARYPDVRLQVHFSTRHVDLRRDGYDVAIRGSFALEPGLVARVLGRGTVVGIASPEYLARHGKPRNIRDLRTHNCLLGFARGELPQTHWTDRKGRKVLVEGTIASNSIVFLCEAALRGQGIALLPLGQVRDYLERGELVQVLEGILGGDTLMTVVYPEREFLPPQVRAFVDTIVAWVQSDERNLWPGPPSKLPALPASKPKQTKPKKRGLSSSPSRHREPGATETNPRPPQNVKVRLT